MQLGHSWRPMCGVVVELGINDIFCRSAFKDAVLWYNSSPVTPQFASTWSLWRASTWSLWHTNHFCCAECISRQRLASKPRAESGRAHRTSNGRADSAQLTNDGSTCTLMHCCAERGPPRVLSGQLFRTCLGPMLYS